MMTIHSKVCRRISRNCMSWIIMPFNQINQLIHFLIWILKLPHLLLSLMIMISSPKLLKGTMKRAKMIKMMKKVSHQRVHQLMKLKTHSKRCNTFPCSVRAETNSFPYTEHGKLVEQIDNFKQSVVTDFFKGR